MSDQYAGSEHGGYDFSSRTATPPQLPPVPSAQSPGTTKKRGGCFSRGLLIAVIIVVALVALSVTFRIFSDSSDSTDGEYGVDEMPRFNEVWSSGQGEEKVVRVPVKGVILLQGGGLMTGGSEATRFALACIQRATMDPDVKGLLLEINSPGGGITASDVVYHAIKEFKRAQPGRQVVALMGDVAASGGYYVALAADEIIAHPTTVTGSIGVLMQGVNFHELAGRLGIQDQTIKSGAYKDMMNPLTPVNEQENVVLQGIINRMYERFISLVASERELELDAVRSLADGRVFVAEDAQNSGLIDRIGYHAEAVARLDALLPGEGLKVIRYEAPASLLESLLGGGSSFAGRIDSLRLDATSRLMYRWNP